MNAGKICPLGEGVAENAERLERGDRERAARQNRLRSDFSDSR